MSANLLPLALNESWTELPAGLLGQKIIGKDGRAWRLVKNVSGGALSRRQLLRYTSAGAFEVTTTSLTTHKGAGLVPEEWGAAGTIPNNDHFFMQVGGRVTFVLGSDVGGAAVIGDWVEPSGVEAGRAKGRVPGAPDAAIPQTVIARAVTAQAVAGSTFTAHLLEDHLEIATQ